MSAESAGPDRRTILRGAGTGLVALPLLAACGTTDGESAPRQTGPVSTADVPVGEGVITSFGKQPVVVTQPAKGDFKAFSAICTHQQCVVQRVHDGVIECPCHGSEFSVKDGSVVRGPASRPLPPVRIQVEGGTVRPA